MKFWPEFGWWRSWISLASLICAFLLMGGIAVGQTPLSYNTAGDVVMSLSGESNPCDQTFTFRKHSKLVKDIFPEECGIVLVDTKAGSTAVTVAYLAAGHSCGEFPCDEPAILHEWHDTGADNGFCGTVYLNLEAKVVKSRCMKRHVSCRYKSWILLPAAEDGSRWCYKARQ